MLCPVCNGMIPLDASCPACGSRAEDEGRPEDWTGPYSPYELTPQAVSESGASSPVCAHLAVCQACRSEFIVPVGLWNH